MTEQPGGSRGIKRILIAQPIDPVGPDGLARAGFEVRSASSSDPDVLVEEIRWADALIVRNLRVERRMLEVAQDLKVIGVHGVGTDPIDLATASERGVVVFNTPDSNFKSVAEHTFALLLGLAKCLVPANAAVRAGDYAYRYAAAPLALDGKTIGIVGLGRVGRAVATLASAFGMRVLAFDPAIAQGAAVEMQPGWTLVDDLDRLVEDADVITLHVPLTPETRGMIDAARIGRMKRSAILLNTARGALIDEAALAEAVQEGRLGGVGLDVFAVEPVPAGHPLTGFDRVIVTPHLAGSSDEAMRRAALALVEGMTRASLGERPANLVNPSAWEAAAARIRG